MGWNEKEKKTGYGILELVVEDKNRQIKETGQECQNTQEMIPS